MATPRLSSVRAARPNATSHALSVLPWPFLGLWSNTYAIWGHCYHLRREPCGCVKNATPSTLSLKKKKRKKTSINAPTPPRRCGFSARSSPLYSPSTFKEEFARVYLFVPTFLPALLHFVWVFPKELRFGFYFLKFLRDVESWKTGVISFPFLVIRRWL